MEAGPAAMRQSQGCLPSPSFLEPRVRTPAPSPGRVPGHSAGGRLFLFPSNSRPEPPGRSTAPREVSLGKPRLDHASRRLTSPRVPNIHKSFLGRRMVPADTTLENSEGPTVSWVGRDSHACECNQEKREAGVTGPLTPHSYSFPPGNPQGTAVICLLKYPFPSPFPLFS